MSNATTETPGVLPRPTAHSRVSIRRIWAIGINTLTELVRLKVFYFMFIFGLLLLGGALLSVNFSFEEEFQMLKDVGLGAMSIFTALLAIVTTAMLLPKDIEDRTLYTILAKPVHRFEYLMGKLLGVLVLLLLSLLFMTVLFLAMLHYRESVRLAQVGAEYAAAPASEEAVDAVRAIRQAASSSNLWVGFGVIYLRACIVASATLLISTFATSSIFTIIVSFMVYLIGHLQGVAREQWMTAMGSTAHPLKQLFLGPIAIIFPDMQAFNVVDELVAGANLSIDLLARIWGLGLFYCAVYFLLSCLIFSSKEL
jgi:ABC-type Na+ efflux pump permease subunit